MKDIDPTQFDGKIQKLYYEAVISLKKSCIEALSQYHNDQDYVLDSEKYLHRMLNAFNTITGDK